MSNSELMGPASTALCMYAVLYEDKLVTFRTCAAWASGFNRVFFRHHQVQHATIYVPQNKCCKATELLTMPSPKVNLSLWWSMRYLTERCLFDITALQDVLNRSVSSYPILQLLHGCNFATRTSRNKSKIQFVSATL